MNPASDLDLPRPASRHEQMLLERESCAWREVARTAVQPAVAWMLTLFFLATLVAVPIAQYVVKIPLPASAHPPLLPPGEPHEHFAAHDLFSVIARAPGHFHRAKGSSWKRLTSANATLLRDLAGWEDDLEEYSLFSQFLLPPTQWFLTKYLGHGNEQVYLGRHGWLFYRPDVDYVTSPGFLDPGFLHRRPGLAESGPPRHSDPRPAILNFHRQLQSRGVELVLLPTPVKSVVHPEHFAGLPETSIFVQNPSYGRFVHDLERAGVNVFDLEWLLAELRIHPADLYLATDTHWRPEVMQSVARELARYLGAKFDLPVVPAPPLRPESVQVTGFGDVARMLKTPEHRPLHPPESVTTRQILSQTGEFWRPARTADVLLLGDSFANMYSLPGLGWGESAGLAEQLSFELNRPIDTLLRNDGGSHATRQMLSDELARGRDRLAGKRIVIWQFAVRELATGDWKPLPMELQQSRSDGWLSLESGQRLLVSGIIRDISAIPKPGSVPYRDHIATVHLTDLDAADSLQSGHPDALVYVWTMRNNQWTDAARWRPGQRVRLRLAPWNEMEATLGGLNRSELDDDALLLAEPHWGELP